jgi:N-acetylglutamate synthase-like GNAT family acetyltransferase
MIQESADKPQTVCPNCGNPIGTGHADSCGADKIESEKTGEYSVEEITSPEDRKKYFILYLKVWGKDSELLPLLMEEFKDPNIHHIYAVKRQGQVVAGAKFTVINYDNRPEAYLNKKVVRADSQGENFASQLVKIRLDKAKALGCKRAYCLIANDEDGSKAARSLFKDGFIFKKIRKDKKYEVTDLDHYYYAEKALDSPSPAAMENDIRFDTIPQIRDPSELNKPQLMVAWTDSHLINIALDKGYCGIQLVLPKDSATIKQPMLVLDTAAR